MACRVMIDNGWKNGWIKGWACAGIVSVLVAGATHSVPAAYVQVDDGRGYRPVRIEEIPNHTHEEVVPATPFGQSVEQSGSIATATEFFTGFDLPPQNPGPAPEQAPLSNRDLA